MESSERSITNDEEHDEGVENEIIEDVSNMTKTELTSISVNIVITEEGNESEEHKCEDTTNGIIMSFNGNEYCGRTSLKETCDSALSTNNFNIKEEKGDLMNTNDIFTTNSSNTRSTATASILTDTGVIASKHQCLVEETSNVEIFCPNLDQKCHNLPISQLRRKLSFCPVCETQYGNHKMANMCLGKHGKRQCWLCLDILSSKKEDFYRHCMEFHSISKIGDIVGCPYCGKCFDFRQGLNQHIVKIHFAENISDIESVASLSPTTLVDIFTGKPRTPSSSSDDILPHQLFQTDDKQVGMAFPVVGKSYNNDTSMLKKGTTSANIVPSDNISPTNTITSHSHPHQFTTRDSQRCMALVGKPNLIDGITSSPRPSVIASCYNAPAVQKMNVPPETSLSSLMRGSFQQYSVEQNISYNQAENRLEVEENASFEWQNAQETNLSPLFPKSVQFQDVVQMRRVSTPEVYDTMYHERFSPEKHPSTCTSNLTRAVPQEKIPTCSYFYPNASPQQSVPDAGNNRNSGHTQSIMGKKSNSKMTMDPDIITPQFTTVVEGTKSNSYSNASSDNMNMLSSSICGILKVVKNVDQRISEPRRELSAKPALKSSTNGSDLSSSNSYPRIGTGARNRFPESESFAVPKIPENCGMKRRILTKALWDEHQSKKPFQTHTVLDDVNPETSGVSEPLCSRNSTGTHSAICTRDYSGDPELHVQLPLIQFNPPPSCLMPKKDAAQFFEQFIKQDINHEGPPLKFLDLAHTSTHVITGGKERPNLDYCSRDSSVMTFVKGLPPVPASFSIGNQPYSSCAHYNYELQRPNSKNVNVYPTTLRTSDAYAFPRPSIYPAHLRGRRPPNHAFWDTLRARLISSQRPNYNDIGTSAPFKNSAFSPTCTFASHFGDHDHRGTVENIVVQNPFDEESFSKEHHLAPGGRNRSEGSCSRVTNEAIPTQITAHHAHALGLSEPPNCGNSMDSTFRCYPCTKSTIISQHCGTGNGMNWKNVPGKTTSAPCEAPITAMGKSDINKAPPHSDFGQQHKSSGTNQHIGVALHQPKPIFFPSRYSDEYHNMLEKSSKSHM